MIGLVAQKDPAQDDPELRGVPRGDSGSILKMLRYSRRSVRFLVKASRASACRTSSALNHLSSRASNP